MGLAHATFSEQFLKQISSPASPRLGLQEKELEPSKPELGEMLKVASSSPI